jgi:pimeloyl-ACP methyl ester carboxylesterase
MLLAAACSGGQRRTAGVAPPPPVTEVEAIIGPEGGTLAFPAGPHAGVSLEVPAGAVAAPTRFAIHAASNPQILSAFPVYRFEPREVDFSASPLRATVRIGEVLVDAQGNADVACFAQFAPAGTWNVLVATDVDAAARTARAATARLGDFVAWNGTFHRLFTQDRGLLDPAAEVASETITGLAITVANGSTPMHVGRGSLASFWSSPASENVLIVPGFLGSPLDFLGPEDVSTTLPPSVHNIVLYSYPSALGVAANANALYDEIAAHRQPGFGCTIVGHSLGGLIARYLLERSHEDRARPAWSASDESLAGTVTQVFLLGVPNAGSELGQQLADVMLPGVPAAEQYLLQSAIDLSYRPDSIVFAMNAAYADNAARYHVLYGDLGNGSDGVVSVASALALPLFPPETSMMFVAAHDALHLLGGSNGVTDRIVALLQAP